MSNPVLMCVACGSFRSMNGEDVARRVHQLEAENARLRKALERINGFTMSQFMGPHDMALECVLVARDALNLKLPESLSG